MSSDSLPIRHLTLYKHGVAFVQRGGTLDADKLELTFRSAEVNDVLKSLLVIDGRGGQVHGIQYATPVDPAAQLAANPITLAPDHSLLDLLGALRGRLVRLAGGEPTQREELSGRLVGVDVDDSAVALRQGSVSVLDEASGTVHTLPLRRIRELTLLEPRAQQDLGFFLHASRSDALHSTVTVRLSPGPHDLRVSYLVPSPTWRVSYRLVAEATQEEPASNTAPQGGTLLLQGWGLFDNPFEEDLHDVGVTLTAGQPISFVYDLAASRIPERTVVQDTQRVAAPVEFEDALQSAGQSFAAESSAVFSKARRAVRMPSPAAAPMAAASIEELARQSISAGGTEAGELFQYDVVAPVSVLRGQSALVPILSAQLPYRRELLFNEAKLSGHPVAALRFTNASGLVLERGPVTILENGTYRGEAIVPFTREDGELVLAFAVELGIKITLTRDTANQAAGIRIEGRLLHMQHASVFRTVYRLENNLVSDEVVLVEHPIRQGTELVDTPPPAGQTSGWYRWSVSCPARRATTFTVSERRYDWQVSELLDLPYARLQEFLQARWLDAPTLARIQALLDERAAVARNEAEIEQLGNERDAIFRREEQLRANMATLSAGGEEGELRRQIVARLQASEDRLAAIDARVVALEEEAKRREAAIEAELASLSVG